MQIQYANSNLSTAFLITFILGFILELATRQASTYADFRHASDF